MWFDSLFGFCSHRQSLVWGLELFWSLSLPIRERGVGMHLFIWCHILWDVSQVLWSEVQTVSSFLGNFTFPNSTVAGLTFAKRDKATMGWDPWHCHVVANMYVLSIWPLFLWQHLQIMEMQKVLVSSALLSMEYVMQLHTGITCCKTPTTRQTLYRLKFPTMPGRSSCTGPLMLYTV